MNLIYDLWLILLSQVFFNSVHFFYWVRVSGHFFRTSSSTLRLLAPKKKKKNSGQRKRKTIDLQIIEQYSVLMAPTNKSCFVKAVSEKLIRYFFFCSSWHALIKSASKNNLEVAKFFLELAFVFVTGFQQ